MATCQYRAIISNELELKFEQVFFSICSCIMYLQMTFIYFSLKFVNAYLNNSLIIDYFTHKRISNLIGYSCNTIEDDALLMKTFSENKMIGIISKLNNDFEISQFSRDVSSRKLGIFLDTRCYTLPNVISLFSNATNYKMYDELHDWLILGGDLDKILSIVDDTAFGISTNFAIAIFNRIENNYKLYDVYNMFKDRGGTLNVTLYGEWNTRGGLNVSLTQPKLTRRFNLHGLRLKAMFFKSNYKPKEMPLSQYYEQSKNGFRDGRSKYGYNIMKHLADLHNFTFELWETKSWVPGDKLGPFLRPIVIAEVDITGTPFHMFHERISLLKYVHMGLPYRTCFIFRNPQPTTIKVKKIFYPFANQVWFFKGLIIGLSTFTFSMTLCSDDHELLINVVSNSFMVVVGCICQQGTDFDIPQYSTRIVFITIMIFSLLMCNFYSASVTSARLDEAIYKINDSLVELAKLNLKMASENISYIEYFLKESFWETKIFYENYWLKLPESERFMAPEMGLKLVKEGGFAYHVLPDVGYTFIERVFDNREICELAEVHLTRPTMLMFGVTNNSTFRELVRVGLTKISEAGLRRRQLSKWISRRPLCAEADLSIASVAIHEFAPHLILLLTGILLSFVVYVIEVINIKWVIEIPPNDYVGERRLMPNGFITNVR